MGQVDVDRGLAWGEEEGAYLEGGPYGGLRLGSPRAGEERLTVFGEGAEVYLGPDLQALVQLPAGPEGGQAYVGRVGEGDQRTWTDGRRVR